MKKQLILPLLSILVLIGCTGCTPETGTMTCTMSSYPADGIKLRSVYKANYKNNIVKKLISTDQVTVEDKEYLNTYEEKLEELYQPYKKLEYYQNNIKIKSKTLTSTTNINYAKIDTDELIKIDEGNGQLIKNGKVNINDLEEAYKQNGFNCKKEG